VWDLLATYFAAFMTPFLILGQTFATASAIFLGLAAMIRGVIMIVEALVDGDTIAETLPKLGRGLVIVSILIVGLTQWGNIQGFVLSFAQASANVVCQGFSGAPPVPDAPPPRACPQASLPPLGAAPAAMAQFFSTRLVKPVTEDAMTVVARVWRYYELQSLYVALGVVSPEQPPPGVDLDTWVQARIDALEAERDGKKWWEKLFGAVTNPFLQIRMVLATAIALICVLIFAIVVMYYVVGALVVIMVALAVGPLALAIAPFDNTYVKQAGEAAVSGSIQLAIVVNLVALAAGVILALTLNLMSRPTLYTAVGLAETALAGYIVPVLCVVLAFLVPRIINTVAEIFRGGRFSSPQGAMKRLGQITKFLQ
jgi:hypothetical protein